jgi:Regulator of Chromosome Condensation (RCC1) repeat protein
VRPTPVGWKQIFVLLGALGPSVGCSKIIGLEDVPPATPVPGGAQDAAFDGTPDGSTPDGSTGCVGTPCGATCTDTSSDPRNCGACNHDCTALMHIGTVDGVTCAAGRCVVPPTSCASGYAHCTANADDGCETDVGTAAHCGSCAKQCSTNVPFCAAGQCVTSCPAATPTPCGSACVNLDTDPAHCGDCTKACPQPATGGNATCSNKTCGFSCLANWHSCPGTTECAPDTDATRCGSTCMKCPGTSDGDPNGDAVCANNQCGIQCHTNYTKCSTGICVDTANDSKNCGACGHDCTSLSHIASSANVTCASGKCVVPGTACAQGFDHCTTNPDDGCETDLTRADHCRACATTCPADKPICGPTSCVGCPPGLRPCNGACVDPSVDPSCGGYLLSEGFCMIKAGGTVWCWGGSPTPAISQVPGLTSVIQISGAFGAGCALKNDGTVWCWLNAPPTDISYGMKFRHVAGSGGLTCAIDTSENVYCLSGSQWILVGSSLLVTHLSLLPSGDAAARAKDGTIWLWNQPNSPSPVVLALSGTYAQVEIDQESTVLRTSAGAVLYNQMPVTGTAFAGATFTQVAAGLRGGCALASDGRVACWGYGPYGQLGDGNFQMNSDTMVQFGGVNFRASEVARSGLRTCALKIDGTVWCAGNAVSPNGDAAIPVQLNVVVP